MISIVNDFEVKEKIFIKKYSIHKKFKHKNQFYRDEIKTKSQFQKGNNFEQNLIFRNHPI